MDWLHSVGQWFNAVNWWYVELLSDVALLAAYCWQLEQRIRALERKN